MVYVKNYKVMQRKLYFFPDTLHVDCENNIQFE